MLFVYEISLLPAKQTVHKTRLKWQEKCFDQGGGVGGGLYTGSVPSSALGAVSPGVAGPCAAAAWAVGTLAAASAYVRGLPNPLHLSSSSVSSDQLDIHRLSSHPPSGPRAISEDSCGSICSLLAITINPSHFSHAQALGCVAAAITGTVKAVPGAAGPPAWPVSWHDVAATADVHTPDERLSSKADAAVLKGLAPRQFFSAARPLSSSVSRCPGAFFPSSEIY